MPSRPKNPPSVSVKRGIRKLVGVTKKNPSPKKPKIRKGKVKNA